MVKSITNFINGSVYITNESNASVYLSDGTHWNKKNFHQTRGIISAFIRREVDLDPCMQELKQVIIEKNKLADARMKEADEIITNALSFVPTMNMFKDSGIIMPFGQYKGETLGFIYNKDKQYFEWLFNIGWFEPYYLRNKTSEKKPVNLSTDLPF